ncbi:MAG TPA: hypothetical protein DD390_15445 [Rhodospirillaceae bacterium]|nr:hypothetical protein [Rhodospirillaceae bacterium]
MILSQDMTICLILSPPFRQAQKKSLGSAITLRYPTQHSLQDHPFLKLLQCTMYLVSSNTVLSMTNYHALAQFMKLQKI